MMPSLHLKDELQKHKRPFVECLLPISALVAPVLSTHLYLLHVSCAVKLSNAPSPLFTLFPPLREFFLFFSSFSFLQIKFNYCLLQELYLSQVLLFCVFFVPSTYHIIDIVSVTFLK